MPRIEAAEQQLARAHADIQRLLRTKLVPYPVDANLGGTTDVDDPHLPALQEVVHAVGLADPVRQPDRLVERHDAAHHDPADLAVGHGQFAWPEHLRDEELAAQALGIEGTGMRGMDGLAGFHHTAPWTGSAAAVAAMRSW